MPNLPEEILGTMEQKKKGVCPVLCLKSIEITKLLLLNTFKVNLLYS